MKECKHIFINELTYSHPKKFGKQIVMRKCKKCGYRYITERSVLFSLSLNNSSDKDKTFTKKVA